MRSGFVALSQSLRQTNVDSPESALCGRPRARRRPRPANHAETLRKITVCSAPAHPLWCRRV